MSAVAPWSSSSVASILIFTRRTPCLRGCGGLPEAALQWARSKPAPTCSRALGSLLDHRNATIHWENMESFVEEFPKVRLTGRIFEIDRKRFTASGAAAAMDMMLHFIAQHLGQKVASAVAEEFIYNRMRGPEIPQRLEAAERMHTRHPRLRRLLEVLDSHLEDRLDVADMAATERISEREVRRLFRNHLGCSPQAYHRGLRLQRARLMLRQSDMLVVDVAIRCGFASSSDFSRAFRREFQQKPLEERAGIRFMDR
jgi:transcriptional regulator GlxA family with amidase domain